MKLHRQKERRDVHASVTKRKRHEKKGSTQKNRADRFRVDAGLHHQSKEKTF